MGKGTKRTVATTEVLHCSHLLLVQVRDHLLRAQRPEQSGFTPKKSTVDRVLALRVLWNADLNFNKESLWSLLDLRGILPRIVGLQSGLYTDTKSAVKCMGGISDFFPVSAGMCPGPNPFQYLCGLDTWPCLGQ
ncbi:uncharacterized protein LOC119584716 [Penaeus monodon]|uniref:uncharacterized protein LOC119584716 n=1 Tax=Penaeus monodon TaxID=6687 RepID=UPI0018A79508|nr:uncharacterized protein LOC119584716 [Penaeus monodon]